MLHIIGIDPNDPEGLRRYLGERPAGGRVGTRTVDHIAFLAPVGRACARDWKRQVRDFIEREVPSLGLRQVFLSDPSGVRSTDSDR